MDEIGRLNKLRQERGLRGIPRVAPPNPRTGAAAPQVAASDDLVARALTILAGETNKGHQSPSDGLPLQQRVLSDGTRCALPIRYFDVQCLVATFSVEFDRAAELLENTGLQVAPQGDGKASILLYCIEYRVTDIGSYNEVGLTIMAAAAGDSNPAQYVVNLPVSTPLANRVGREIWGYNKFVAVIDIRGNRDSFSTTLSDLDGAMIGSFDYKRSAVVSAPPKDIITFTLLNGRVIKTRIQVFTPFQAGGGDGFAVTIGVSKHPMAKNLRSLALDGACPETVLYANPFQALLFPGRVL
jgi:acetoacetate decarboxylase